MVDERMVRVLGHLGLAEQNLAAGDTEHHDGMTQRGIQHEPLQVLRCVATGLLVGGHNVGDAHEIGHTRHPELFGEILEEAM